MLLNMHLCLGTDRPFAQRADQHVMASALGGSPVRIYRYAECRPREPFERADAQNAISEQRPLFRGQPRGSDPSDAWQNHILLQGAVHVGQHVLHNGLCLAFSTGSVSELGQSVERACVQHTHTCF